MRRGKPTAFSREPEPSQPAVQEDSRPANRSRRCASRLVQLMTVTVADVTPHWPSTFSRTNNQPYPQRLPRYHPRLGMRRPSVTWSPSPKCLSDHAAAKKRELRRERAKRATRTERGAGVPASERVPSGLTNSKAQAASSPSASRMGTSTPSAKRAASTNSPFIASMNLRSVPT